jgi:hypothetical protein
MRTRLRGPHAPPPYHATRSREADNFSREVIVLTRFHLLGLLLAPFIALPCVWHGQRQANPEARLLLVPEVILQALR